MNPFFIILYLFAPNIYYRAAKDGEFDMQVINKQAKLIAKVLGKQEKSNLEYRLLHFCVLLPYRGISLLYNNLTKEMLELDDKEVAELKNAPIFFGNEFVDYLIENWFLVPLDFDDLKFSKQLTSLARQFDFDRTINTFEIVTTTACNARCFYCYEAGVKQRTMTIETAQAVVNYIMKNRRDGTIYLKWFGGEPTCNTKVIDYICAALTEKKVAFRSIMVSNGYLFDAVMVERAKSIWNLKDIQITLDGTEDTYNTVKNYVGAKDKSPFKRVINNIDSLLKADITVTVRINMDRHNENELYSLVDLLCEKFSEYKKFNVYAHLLFENVGNYQNSRSESERIDIGKSFDKLQTHIEKIGLGGQLRLHNNVKISHCMADSYATAFISPEGNLGRCEHYVDDDFYGTVFDNTPKKIWDEYYLENPECYTCPAFPTCLRLLKCKPDTPKCYDYQRKENLRKIHRQMIGSYRDFLKK